MIRRVLVGDKHRKALEKFDIEHRRRYFDDKCEFRYDEFRPGNGEQTGSGEHTLSNHCILKKHGSRKCDYPNATHTTCPQSTHKKPKKKRKRKEASQ